MTASRRDSASPAKQRKKSGNRDSWARVSLSGRPLLSVSSRYSVSRLASKASARRLTSRARARISMPPQARPSKAVRALFIARSTSSAVEFGIRAITSPVAGLRTSSISPAPASISRPSTKLPWISTSMAAGFAEIFMWLSLSTMISGQTLCVCPEDHGFGLDDDRVALECRQHALFGLTDMRLDDAPGAAPVAPLHRLDQGDV